MSPLCLCLSGHCKALYFRRSINQLIEELLFSSCKHSATVRVLQTPTTFRAHSLTGILSVLHWTFREFTTLLQQRVWPANQTHFYQSTDNQTKSFENKTRLYRLCDNRWLPLSSPLTPGVLEQFGQYDVFWSLAHEENHRCKVSAWHLAWRTRSSHRTHHCSRW